MGSGGDLNSKKSWHPLRKANISATQKAEADAIAERKKLAARLEEIKEDRKREELQRALEAAGGKVKPYDSKLAWMYSGPTDGQADASEKEAYLLGKRRIDKLLQDSDLKKLQDQSIQDNLIAPQGAVTNARDIASKIREDPMFAMKKAQQDAYEAALKDPLGRQKLLAQAGITDSSKSKEHRHHRHREHRRHHRHRDDEEREDRHREDRSSRRRRSDSRDYDRSRSPKRYDSDEDRSRRRRHDSSRRRRELDSDEERGYRRRDRGRDSPRRRHDADSEEERASRRRRCNRDDDRRNSEPETNRDRRHYRDRENDQRPKENGRRYNDQPSRRQDDDERARKLAAMQSMASDLDAEREQRLAKIEEADRTAKEEDERERKAATKWGGGDRALTAKLYSQANEAMVGERRNV